MATRVMQDKRINAIVVVDNDLPVAVLISRPVASRVYERENCSAHGI